MAIVRWSDPIREFAQLQDRINRAFSDAYGRSDEGLVTSGAWVPPVDIYQNGNQEIVPKAEQPDLTRDDDDITVDMRTLPITGEKKVDDGVNEDDVHRMELRYGTFSRTLTLPPAVDTTIVGAEYKNGVLTVRLPLREEA